MSPAGSYAVRYERGALKELQKLDRLAARRIVRAVEGLAATPRPAGARPLVGHPDLWRLRVGAYRVIYTVRDDALLVLVLRTAHRGEVDRTL